MTEAQADRLQSLRAQIGEFFDEYLLICKPAKNTVIACASDSTWAIGAVRRFSTLVDEDDRVGKW